MDSDTRRKALAEYLGRARSPVSAAALAREFSVSRQIIVGDVALLRAGGEEVTATPRGYVLDGPRPGIVRTVACVHSGADMERELTLVVDQGCTVENVIVEHPVYGQITGPLALSSRYDVGEFLRRVRECGAQPLSALTDGVHLHTLRCPDEGGFERARAALDQAGFLVK